MHTATYFDDQNLLFVSCSDHINFTSLTARVAEWIITIGAPEDRLVLVDLRRLQTVDRPAEGAEEYSKMQKKLAQDYPAAKKLALLVARPETFVLARAFEQATQGHVTTETEVFRDQAEALAFLGLNFKTLGELTSIQGNVTAMH